MHTVPVQKGTWRLENIGTRQSSWRGLGLECIMMELWNAIIVDIATSRRRPTPHQCTPRHAHSNIGHLSALAEPCMLGRPMASRKACLPSRLPSKIPSHPMPSQWLLVMASLTAHCQCLLGGFNSWHPEDTSCMA